MGKRQDRARRELKQQQQLGAAAVAASRSRQSTARSAPAGGGHDRPSGDRGTMAKVLSAASPDLVWGAWDRFTRHMTTSRTAFSSYEAFDGPREVEVCEAGMEAVTGTASGRLPAVGVGRVELVFGGETIVLEEVLHVDDNDMASLLRQNLISVPMLTEAGYTVEHTNGEMGPECRISKEANGGSGPLIAVGRYLPIPAGEVNPPIFVADTLGGEETSTNT